MQAYMDLGYQGNDTMPGADLHIPHKKPKGGKLTRTQKKENQKLSSRRVIVEHAIGGIKQFGIMRRPYIGTTEGFERDLKIVCGLSNMRRMIAQESYDSWMKLLEGDPPPV